MRLIDADALKSKIIKTLGISEEKYLLPAERTIYKTIDTMPTVERPTAEWREFSKQLGLYECIHCHNTRRVKYPYCPFCGRKMTNFFPYLRVDDIAGEVTV